MRRGDQRYCSLYRVGVARVDAVFYNFGKFDRSVRVGWRLGTAVFFGMLGVTFFGLLLTPVFYVVIRGFASDRTADDKQSVAASLEKPLPVV